MKPIIYRIKELEGTMSERKFVYRRGEDYPKYPTPMDYDKLPALRLVRLVKQDSRFITRQGGDWGVAASTLPILHARLRGEEHEGIYGIEFYGDMVEATPIEGT